MEVVNPLSKEFLSLEVVRLSLGRVPGGAWYLEQLQRKASADLLAVVASESSCLLSL